MMRTVSFIALVLFMLAAAAFLFVAKAEAQPIKRCSSHAEMLAMLSERFGERFKGKGIQGAPPPRILELYVSPGGSWTIFETGIDNQSCIQASGTHWRHGPPELDARQ